MVEEGALQGFCCISQKFGLSLVSSFRSGLGIAGRHLLLTGLLKHRTEAVRNALVFVQAGQCCYLMDLFSH